LGTELRAPGGTLCSLTGAVSSRPALALMAACTMPSSESAAGAGVRYSLMRRLLSPYSTSSDAASSKGTFSAAAMSFWMSDMPHLKVSVPTRLPSW